MPLCTKFIRSEFSIYIWLGLLPSSSENIDNEEGARSVSRLGSPGLGLGRVFIVEFIFICYLSGAWLFWPMLLIGTKSVLLFEVLGLACCATTKWTFALLLLITFSCWKIIWNICAKSLLWWIVWKPKTQEHLFAESFEFWLNIKLCFYTTVDVFWILNGKLWWISLWNALTC